MTAHVYVSDDKSAPQQRLICRRGKLAQHACTRGRGWPMLPGLHSTPCKFPRDHGAPTQLLLPITSCLPAAHSRWSLLLPCPQPFPRQSWKTVGRSGWGSLWSPGQIQPEPTQTRRNVQAESESLESRTSFAPHYPHGSGGLSRPLPAPPLQAVQSACLWLLPPLAFRRPTPITPMCTSSLRESLRH